MFVIVQLMRSWLAASHQLAACARKCHEFFSSYSFALAPKEGSNWMWLHVHWLACTRNAGGICHGPPLHHCWQCQLPHGLLPFRSSGSCIAAHSSVMCCCCQKAKNEELQCICCQWWASVLHWSSRLGTGDCRDWCCPRGLCLSAMSLTALSGKDWTALHWLLGIQTGALLVPCKKQKACGAGLGQTYFIH